MIHEHAKLNKVVMEHLFDGSGSTEMTHFFLPGDAFCDKGKLFSRTLLKPGASIGNHMHTNEFEIYYILKGEGKYNDNGVDAIVKEGDVTICNSGETHGIENTGKVDLEMIILILYT